MLINIDTKPIRKLLEIYFEITGISTSLYLYNDNIYIPSSQYRTEFCRECNRIIKYDNFNDFYLTTEGLHQCPGGLWYYSFPLKIEGELIGCFIIGHRRILGKESESWAVLKKTIFERKLDGQVAKGLLNLLETVDYVTEEDFNANLLEKLTFIGNYIFEEKQRALNEHQRSIAIKNESESLAHEFLLPIQSIIADAENLAVLASETKNLEIENLAEDILQEMIKLSFIAENIRGSVIGENKLKFEFGLVDIYDVISETADLYRKEARNKNVNIVKKLKTGQIFIEASKPHMRQVFFNLIHNAVKYSYSSNESCDRFILITCDSSKNMFICEISNYGIGILPEEIEQRLIFKKGYRGLLSRDRSRIGSGLGLFKVNEIIKAHKGKIEVESRKVGFGFKIDPYITTFKVYLPYTQIKEVKSNEIAEDFMDRR